MTLQEAAHCIAELKDRVAALEAIVSELRLHRRVARPVDPAAVEALLAYCQDAMCEVWTAAEVFKESHDHPLLRGALIRCIGPLPTVKLIARFFGRLSQTITGTEYGDYQLHRMKDHSNIGALYRVTKRVSLNHQKFMIGS